MLLYSVAISIVSDAEMLLFIDRAAEVVINAGCGCPR